MISSPQGDLKHTGHVGLDGAYFGDISFLGGKYPHLPRQVVTPYKPQEDATDNNSSQMASQDVTLRGLDRDSNSRSSQHAQRDSHSKHSEFHFLAFQYLCQRLNLWIVFQRKHAFVFIGKFY